MRFTLLLTLLELELSEDVLPECVIISYSATDLMVINPRFQVGVGGFLLGGGGSAFTLMRPCNPVDPIPCDPTQVTLSRRTNTDLL